MKIKINNLVELVHALEKYEALYYPDGVKMTFNSKKQGVNISENGITMSLGLHVFPWGFELETIAPLRDKQAVWCWDNTDNFSRIAKFYDTKNNCTFSSYTGVRNGNRYSSYEPIPMNEDGSFPDGFEWMEEAQKNLKD